MDALDLFPLAGIRFISVAHEQGGGHMADGYARVSGRHGVCIAQNGPGITNFVTSTAAAFWAHSPVVVITPETGSDDARPRRLPGNRAAADLLEDHQVPGAREQPRADGRAHRPRVRSRAARAGPDAAQHSARLLLRRHRVRDPAADGDRARRGRRAAASTRRPSCSPTRDVPGDPRRRRRRDGRRRRPRRSRSPSCCRRRSPTAICTTTRSRRGIRCGAARSATRAPRRR